MKLVLNGGLRLEVRFLIGLGCIGEERIGIRYADSSSDEGGVGLPNV